MRSRPASPPRTRARDGARRRGLTAPRVVATAIRMADRDGVDALSMRTLAAELGVEAMSLYAHVPSKEVLLGLMAAQIMAGVATPSTKLPPGRRLCKLAHSMRKVALRHPHVFPLVVLKPLDLPAAARPTEIALQAFLDAGVADHRAIRSQRVFLSFVRGYLLWELGGFAAGRRQGPGGKPNVKALRDVAALDPTEFPQIKRLAPVLLRVHSLAAYRDGLQWVLRSLLPDGGSGRGCATPGGRKRAA